MNVNYNCETFIVQATDQNFKTLAVNAFGDIAAKNTECQWISEVINQTVWNNLVRTNITC